jgi:DNA-binding NarL/FixJ family response regulator
MRDIKHDLDHASGATERTLLIAVVDRLILKIKRTEPRYQMHVERFGQTVSEFSRDEINMQAMEIADIIETLTPQEKAVCKGLTEGASRSQIAQELDCSWGTVQRIVQRLRQHFAGFNLDDEATPDANNHP